MKRKSAIIFLSISMMFLLVGCSKTVSEKFITKENSLSYLELKSDGSFYVLKDLAYAGKYTIDGETITFTYPSGLSLKGTIKNNVLIDSEGDEWVKK
jgi:hypothetical protein